jgi:hypothetical protein
VDRETAINRFLQGNVLVSYGLIAELTIAGRYQSGDTAPHSDLPVSDRGLAVEIRVLGPHWTRAEHVHLYSNGTLVRSERLPETRPAGRPAGVHWQGVWHVPPPQQDVHLVAIAVGPGISAPFWRTAKPYQPTTPAWSPRFLGCSGAVWLDVDGDGQRTPAVEYARRAFTAANGDLRKLLEALSAYDEATAAQAAHLYQLEARPFDTDAILDAVKNAAPAVRDGFQSYIQAWQQCQRAELE